MIGSPFVTGREVQQLPSRAGEATLAGQFAELVRDFSIVRAVGRRGTISWLAHRQSLLDAWIRHELHPAKNEIGGASSA
jgi:hypothetical protein